MESRVSSLRRTKRVTTLGSLSMSALDTTDVSKSLMAMLFLKTYLTVSTLKWTKGFLSWMIK
jgi:hypothetical protein